MPIGDYSGGSTSSNSNSNSGGGGGRQDAQSQYGGTTGYESSANQSGRTQSTSGEGGGSGYSNSNQDDARLDYITGPYQDIKLTEQQQKDFTEFQKDARQSITPSTKLSNKVIGGLLSNVLFPGAGSLYNAYLDATAMGYSIPNPFGGIFEGNNITPETITKYQNEGDNSGGSQLIQNILKTVNPDMPDSVAQSYYDNLPQTEKSDLSFKARYNTAKQKVSQTLGTPSAVGLLAVNESPFYDFLKIRGLDRRIL